MYSDSADLYDLIYTCVKDYAAEARWLAAILSEVAPDAHTLLDVACGTGEHARWLRSEHGLAVDGIDLDQAFIALASAKNPMGTFLCADMTGFDLGRRYDVVSCLFGSIAYAKSIDAVRRVALCLAAHLKPRGLVVVEPFLTPEQLAPGRVTARVFEDPEHVMTICRMTHSEVSGRSARITFEYLVGRKGGIDHRCEVHELGLYTHGELLDAMRGAGLAVETKSGGYSGRPLLIGRSP